ncbi:Sugar phosphate exchanger, partial [Globisporangium splendens]
MLALEERDALESAADSSSSSSAAPSPASAVSQLRPAKALVPKQAALKSTIPRADPSVMMTGATVPLSSSMSWLHCAANKSGVFLLTFFSYVMFHACRKSFSAIKGEMSAEQWMHSSLYAKEEQAQMYGLLDTLFMGFYAAGLYISGVLGDNYDLRKMIAGGMWATGAIMFLFGMAAMADIHSLSFYAILWGLNGLIQSCGWPANVAVMQNERGAVLGIWSGNGCFGNIVGTALVSTMFELFDKHVAWKVALIVVALLVAFHATLIHFFLVPDPKFAPYRHEALEEAKPEVAATKSPSSGDKSPLELADLPPKHDDEEKGISFFEAWCIPGMLYDVGQILGGFAGGYISDKMGVRSPVVVVMLLFSCIAIYCFDGASYNMTAFLLLASGFMLGGPANLISTAISADLGTHESIRGNAAALSTVTGIIDGTGSIGAAFVQYLVGYLAQCHYEPMGCDPKKNPNCIEVCSWGPVFVLLEVGTLLACVCLTRLLYHEILIIRNRRRGVSRDH